MAFQEYTRKKEEVIKLLEDMLSNVEGQALEKDVKEKMNCLRNDRFVISVFGHFSNGKSTFLNALMGFGEEILKEDDVASTAAITRIKYAEDSEKVNKAEVYRYNGDVDLITIEELKEYVARNTSVNVEQTIREVVLFLKSDYLKNGVEIVDTPGLNSTYKLHSEIALRQIETSDAAIFMFNYEKPGAYHEIQLLKHIKQYMERVFFVLNKIDLADVTEKRTADEDLVETAINDILRKMQKEGLPVEDKVIYPISARWAKEGIRKNSSELFTKSELPKFMEALSRYLTSGDNIYDRIDAPLKSLGQSVQKEMDRIDDLIYAYNQDSAALKAEMQKRKEKIAEHEKDLREKRKNIRGSVDSEISRQKNEVEDAAEDVISDVKKKLESVNTRFSIHLMKFHHMTLDTCRDFEKRWEKSASELENNLMNIVDTNLDTDEEYREIESRIRRLIRTNLLLEEIEVADPEFDYEELKKYDRKIEEIKRERDRIREGLSSIYTKKDKRAELLEERENIREKLENSIRRKEREIERLSRIGVYHGTRIKPEEQKRGGKIGKGIDWLFGPKTVYNEVEIRDDSEKKQAEKDIARLEKEILNMSDSEELRKKSEEIAEYRGLDYQQEILEADKAIQDRLYQEKLINSREDKDKLEKQIIEVAKDNYISELEEKINEEAEILRDFLENSREKFVNIINDILEREAEKIEEEKDSLVNIESVNSKSPAEIESELKDLYRKKEALRRAKADLEKERKR